MRIPGKATIAACEAALGELSHQSSVQTLTIPTKYNHAWAGGECSWAQFLTTWAQQTHDGRIETYAADASDTQIAELPRRLMGMLAALSGVPMQSRHCKLDLSEQFRAEALKRLEILQSSNPFLASRGPVVEVASADHLGMSAPKFLYRTDSSGLAELRPREQFVRLAAYLLTKTNAVKANVADFEELSRTIGNLLYETIKNTEDHALTTVEGERLNISFRLLHASFIGQTSESLLEVSNDYYPLKDYFSKFSAGESRSQIPFFVISILDSGPGFAATWTGKHLAALSDEEEYSATVDCFSNRTSKGHDRFGQGLPLLRKLLRKRRGFLRLRTGRQSLFYSGFQDTDDGSVPIPLARFQSPESGPLAPAAGSLITVFLPVGIDR